MPIHRAGCAGQEEVGSRVGSAPLSRWTEASTGPRVSLPAELSAKPSLDVLPLRAGGQQGSHLSASWSAVEISLSAVLFSGDPWLCSGALRYPS